MDPNDCDDVGGAISWEERNLQVPEPRRPRKSLAAMSDAEFAEALADLVKVRPTT